MDPQFPEPVASRRSLRPIIGLMTGVGALLLTWWGLAAWESYRDGLGESRDPRTGIELWILGSLLMVLAGFLAGFGIRAVVPGRGFMGGRALAMGVVPLVVGLTFPMIAFEVWPFTTLGAGVLRVVLTPELDVVAWIVVGFALASGLVPGRDIT